MKCKNDVLKIESSILKISSNENIFLKNDNIVIREKLKELSSNDKNEIAKNKIKKSTTSHFVCHYWRNNGHISHTCPIRKKSKKCVKQVRMHKKIMHVNNVKANIQGPHVKRVPEIFFSVL